MPQTEINMPKQLVINKNNWNYVIFSTNVISPICILQMINWGPSLMCTATVTTSWWASSFLREYTEDKSPQLELEVRPHGYSINFDTNGVFTSL